MDFFARQQRAKRTTRLLAVYLAIAVFGIVCAINVLVYCYMHFVHHQSYTLNEWLVQPKSVVVTVATVLIIVMISLIQWYLLREGGDALAKRMGATLIALDTPDRLERQLINVVEEMVIASGLIMPNVYVMEAERGINAFVAGLNQSDAVLVVTHGAMRELTRQELQAVIGHEFSHIVNSDMRINLQLISLLAGILFLSEAGRFVLGAMNHSGCRQGYRREDTLSPFVFLLPMAVILFTVGSIGLLFARLIKASISRQREYLADAASVQYTRDNQGLASALYKISTLSEGSTLQTMYAEEASHMCFSESVAMFSGILSRMLSTHPSTEQRIKAMCPGWMPGRMPEVGRVVQNQSRPGRQSGVVPGSVMALAAKRQSGQRLSTTIGQPASEHMTQARQMIQQIPECLRFGFSDENARFHSMQLMLALLLADDEQQTDQVLAEIKHQYGVEFSQHVSELSMLIKQQPRKQRTVIFDLAVPALKQLHRSERRIFFELMRSIIRLDHHVSRFEYAHYWLLKKQLYGSLYRSQSRVHNLKNVQNQVAIVIAMMIEASGKDEQSRRKIFRLIMATLGLPHMLMPVTQFDSDTIHQAVRDLAQLGPIPKRALLCALEDCITEDNVVDPEEVELFRVIAALMDCPVPPVLNC